MINVEPVENLSFSHGTCSSIHEFRSGFFLWGPRIKKWMTDFSAMDMNLHASYCYSMLLVQCQGTQVIKGGQSVGITLLTSPSQGTRRSLALSKAVRNHMLPLILMSPPGTSSCSSLTDFGMYLSIVFRSCLIKMQGSGRTPCTMVRLR